MTTGDKGFTLELSEATIKMIGPLIAQAAAGKQAEAQIAAILSGICAQAGHAEPADVRVIGSALVVIPRLEAEVHTHDDQSNEPRQPGC